MTSFALGPLSLTGGKIDRGGADRRRQEWLDAALAAPDTRVIAVVRGTTPVRRTGPDAALAAPRLADLPGGPGGQALAAARSTVWIGRVDGVDWVGADFAEEPDWFAALGERGDLRKDGTGLSRTEAALLTQTIAVTTWHATSAYCPGCGAATDVIDAGWVRVCPVEGTEHFPRTDPAVIVLVTDAQDRVLLGANAAWGGARYSCFAGFVEPGESLEEAVIREVGEEAGLAVTEPRYLGSQPWPFPRSLMLAFAARAESTRTDVDGEEIVAARWFSREELAAAVSSQQIGVPGDVSVAGAMLRAWYGGALPGDEPAGDGPAGDKAVGGDGAGRDGRSTATGAAQAGHAASGSEDAAAASGRSHAQEGEPR